jgi:hypothetical protein
MAAQWAPRTGPNGRQVRLTGEAAWLRPFFDPPVDPALLPEQPRQIDVNREDLMRLWPAPSASQHEPLPAQIQSSTPKDVRPALSRARPSSQSGAVTPKQTKPEAVKSFIDEKYPDGIPAGVTMKDLARMVKEEKNITLSTRSVSRGLGRK